MFTGIVLGKGQVFEQRPSGGGLVFGIEADFALDDPEEGESIATNGVCLTAYNISGRRFFVDVSPESLSRTNLGDLRVGGVVNLERALRLSDRLGGHMVSGHVDGVSRVVDRAAKGDFALFSFEVPPGLGRYIIEKGSVALDGVSLTINGCEDRVFSVSIIPHTLEVTTLGSLQKGSTVNLEVDLIGKYVEKLLSVKEDEKAGHGSINTAFLAESGFLK